MTAAALALLRRLDLGYTAGAIAILVNGGLRVFFDAKVPAFYVANPIFWAKLALFAAVGLLRVPPTRHYIESAKSLRCSELVVEEAVFRRIRGCIAAELALILLAAARMARASACDGKVVQSTSTAATRRACLSHRLRRTIISSGWLSPVRCLAALDAGQRRIDGAARREQR
jgi:putative membrane protein